MSKANQAVQYAHERGYYVTEEGDVISPHSGKKLKLRLGTRGYWLFNGQLPAPHSQKYPARVHRLLALQKFGEVALEPNIEVRHLDGNRQNNAWENIAIGSRSDNKMDIPQETRLRIGRQNGRSHSRLNDQDVLDIRALLAKGEMTQQEIADRYDIARQTVTGIKTKHRYKHL
jgi:hypothetical protein